VAPLQRARALHPRTRKSVAPASIDSNDDFMSR
jgi:hypothetical protein